MKNVKTTNKKRTLTIVSIALVAVLIVGGALAYLSGNAGVKDNVFSFADNITGEIEEPNWEAKDVTPGMEVRKDPMITNTSKDKIDEYAAMKVTFKKGDKTTELSNADMSRLLSAIKIDWNLGTGATQWTLINGTLTYDANGDATVVGPLVFSYNSAIKRGESTAPLFSTVTIPQNIDEDDLAWITGNSKENTSACYTFGTCDCTPTVKHHAKCASLSGGACDCSPVNQHDEDCDSLNGTLNATCTHTVAGALNGFVLTVEGAVVQASEFTGPQDSAVIAAFKQLLGVQ